ncbi:hypothetical protein [Salinispora cortesiana]|uniref:hypothetical protein n=1 Tax=Salinispora cortesiana TaxID=1305843 RepID=UPI0012BCD346|nr:hypothetical protein [Salinispora cortesiana]
MASFDLAFWYQKVAPTSDEAAQIYDRLTDGVTGIVEESSAAEDFCAGRLGVGHA